MDKMRHKENLEKSKTKLIALQFMALANADQVKYYKAIERFDTLKDMEQLTSEEMEDFYKTNDAIRVAIEGKKKARKWMQSQSSGWEKNTINRLSQNGG